MDKFVVEGGNRLSGTVQVSGSKNSALPILIASILTNQPLVIRNVPRLRDINTMLKMLQLLGVESVRDEKDSSIKLTVTDPTPTKAPYEYVSQMRASVAVLGPLIAMRKKAVVSLPGGCVIGSRPIDLHLRGLEKLGAKITIEGGYVIAEAQRLKGAMVYLGGSFGSSVLATANLMMAAALAEGTTLIEHAACEPEVKDLGDLLCAMGAHIRGHGTGEIIIEGVDTLNGCDYTVIPDRIEAGTYIVAGAITRSPVAVKGMRIDHLYAVVDKLEQIGIGLEKVDKDTYRVKPAEEWQGVEITTHPYPGFPTDLQAQFMALLSLAKGASVITEKIYPDRFIHAGELNRMGARINREGASAIVNGVPFLSGAQVMASDLRASAALVLGSIAAQGNTEISRVYHIDRGYENIEKKFASLGAKMIRIKE